MYDDKNLGWGFRFVILDDLFIALILIKIMESSVTKGHPIILYMTLFLGGLAVEKKWKIKKGYS